MAGTGGLPSVTSITSPTAAVCPLRAQPHSTTGEAGRGGTASPQPLHHLQGVPAQGLPATFEEPGQ